MTADIDRLLDAMQARCDAATEGPWEASVGEISQSWERPEPWKPIVSTDVSCMGYCYGGSAAGVEEEADAEFIAAARTDLPRLIAAVRAVLEVHERIPSGSDYLVDLCSCQDLYTEEEGWPCRTVTALTAALKEADDD